jgi:hypothetical protein
MKRNNSKDLAIVHQPSSKADNKVRRKDKPSKWLLSIPEIVERLNIARGDRTIEELAIASGVPISVVHRSITGIQFPSMPLLGFFATTGISIDSLVLKHPAKPSLEALQYQALNLSKEDQLKLVAFVLSHQQQSQRQ